MEEIKKGRIIFDKIQNLVNLYENKEDLYYSLIDLEYCGLYGSEEYKRTLEYIEILNEHINEVEASYKLSFDDNFNLSVYLKCTHIELPFSSNIESLLNENSDKVYRRIFDIFYEKNIDILFKKGEEFLNVYIGFKTNEKITYNEQTMLDYVDSDVNRSFLTILQDAIEDSENSDIKHDLLIAKYNLIYLSPRIEQEMLSNKFKINHSIPLFSEFYLDLMETKNSNIKLKITTLKNIKKEFEKINKFDNTDYENNRVETTLRSCYIRANMILLSEKQIELLNRKYYQDLVSSSFNNSKSKNEMLITKTFAKSLKDKKKYFPQPLK